MLHGCDVSDDQGAIDWRLVAMHADFAAVQIAYGTAEDVADTHTGQANIHGAAMNGLKVMPYFFAYPLPGNAKGQGGEFGTMVGDFESEGAVFDLPAAVDVELNPESMAPAAMSLWVRDFLAATHLDPKRLAVYTYPDFWANNTDGSPINAHLWVAAYGAPSAPHLKGLPAPFCWQTTGRGRIPGIHGAVDLDTLLFVPNGHPTPGQGAAGVVTWVVRPGQTLVDVANQYSPSIRTPRELADACAAIAAYNHLAYPVTLTPGQELRIPQPLL